MPTPPAQSRRASLKVTSKVQVTLCKELLADLGEKPGQRLDVKVLPGGKLELHAEQATGTIAGFIGHLAGRSSHRACLLYTSDAADE